ncbi:hypothetical protein BCU70_00390 [Vibrio sp. 10N.286.49.C2]|uniref:hypothetical protein n=1 Tax=unclassified Vibrio TaxID=2614977 RepID=UPI000C8624F7|nr:MULTISPECIES: hypothetical protein [unclassified Vibrio]PMH43361.1 hypothetical protein BCU70_00390 [Vibrio sp. 10N.286.49.C2]PMH57013.1 hypothetical protein BCU66_05780 [Vibrio sp. 10N.286.49.B1]PMH79859.1 hypothetical protein BCU58_04295 [Vibrio sp. 10N.286.48.B7]
MKKSTVALTLISVLSAGSAFAVDKDYDFDKPGNGNKQDDALIQDSGALIGANSGNKMVSNYFKAESPEARKAAAEKYAVEVIKNGGTPIGDTDKFASKSDKNGTLSAHDHLMNEGLKSIRNSDEFKNATDVDAVKLGFQSKSDMRIAVDDAIAEHDENRWGVENAKDANGRIINGDTGNNDPDYGVGAPTPPSKPTPPNKNTASIADNTAAIAQNSGRIDNLEVALKQQGEEMKERYDGVKATMHAVTNARPVAYDVGEFAVGAGIGAAGSKH